MKQYKGVLQENNIELIFPVSDGHIFTFSFPASACKNINIVISLYFDNHRMYSETFYPAGFGNRKSFYNDKSGKCCYGGLGNNKGDFVFRVTKTFPASFKTYINDKFMCTTNAFTYTGMINHENRIHTAGVAIKDTSFNDTVAFTLTVFNHGEYGKAPTLAHAIRNPESSDIKESVEGQAVEDRGANLRSDGADGPELSAVTNNWMKYSSTVVWPTAIELEVTGFATLKTSTQQRHDKLMREWVVAHGDNTLLNTSDYFAHSHRVAWPEALSNLRADIAVKIRERHAQLFKSLP